MFKVIDLTAVVCVSDAAPRDLLLNDGQGPQPPCVLTIYRRHRHPADQDDSSQLHETLLGYVDPA